MKVLIVDDHPMVVSELSRLIGEMDLDVEALGCTDQSEALWRLAIEDSLDVVLLDLQLDQEDGLRILAECRNHKPAIPVLMLSDADDTASVVTSIQAGASGYLPKTLALRDIVDALEVALLGRRGAAATRAVVRPLFQ